MDLGRLKFFAAEEEPKIACGFLRHKFFKSDRELTPAASKCSNQNSDRGRLAQLGERGVRNAEAEGSNPLPSTSHQTVVIIFFTFT